MSQDDLSDNARYIKLKASLRGWALGMAEHEPDFLGIVDALEFSELMTPGFRKCGIKPAHLHPLEVALYVRTIHKSLRYPSETIMAALLHDVPEDNPSVTYDMMLENFGDLVADACEALNKKTESGPKDMDEYVRTLSDDPIASIVKGAYRINNPQSMGVFTLKKQVEYTKEALELYVPMLKAARRAHPDQEAAYENLKLLMNGQIQLLQGAHSSKLNLEKLPRRSNFMANSKLLFSKMSNSINDWFAKWFGEDITVKPSPPAAQDKVMQEQ